MIANTLQVTCGDYSRADGFNAVVEPASVTSAFYSTGGSQNGFARTDGVSPTLKVGSGLDIASPPAVSFEPSTVSFELGHTKGNGPGVNTTGVAYTLDQAAGQGVLTDTLGSEIAKPLGSLTGGPRTTDIENATYVGGPSVRRLTPTECERLMSWPDGWTAVDGDKTPDSRRYAACGNGVVANVSEWIGRRIMAIEDES